MEYVTDAHALLWHLYWSQRLGGSCSADILRGRFWTDLHPCSGGGAEVLMVVQKGRLPGASLDHLVPQLRAMAESDNYPLSPLPPEVVIASHEYTLIPDIFDCLYCYRGDFV